MHIFDTYVRVYAITTECIVDNKQFYTVKEFATLMHLHVNTVRKMIYSGKLYAIPVSGEKNITYRIPWSEIARWGHLKREG